MLTLITGQPGNGIGRAPRSQSRIVRGVRCSFLDSVLTV